MKQQISDIRGWMNDLIFKLHRGFGDRLAFVGLQGSYARGEANKSSDIDAVVILDKLSLHDLQQYQSILQEMPNYDKACGFTCGIEELRHWDAADAFTLRYDTIELYGCLDVLLPPITRKDAQRAVTVGAGNLYHLCVHQFLHGNNGEAIVKLCKAAVFVLRAKCFCDTGKYFKTFKQMENHCNDEDMGILAARKRTTERAPDLAECALLTERLMSWAGGVLCTYGGREC